MTKLTTQEEIFVDPSFSLFSGQNMIVNDCTSDKWLQKAKFYNLESRLTFSTYCKSMQKLKVNITYEITSLPMFFAF